MALNSVTKDIVNFLNASALDLTQGTDLFGYEWGHDAQQEIDKQTLVIENDAFDSPLKDHYEQPVFQILVRGDQGEAPDDVYDRAREIFELLIQEPTQAINGTDYLEFEPLSNVARLGRDENDRYIFSMNFYTYRNPT